MRLFYFTLFTVLIASSPAAAQHDHSQMDHGQMDHGEKAAPKDKAQQDKHAGHDMQAKAPAAVQQNLQSGPPNAADAIWGAKAMQASRKALYEGHGNMSLSWVQGDRLEYRARKGQDGYLWDVQGYYGKDIDKFWFKSEGEGSFGQVIEQAEVQALYSRAIGPFFDFQVGVRQDFHGPKRTHLALGVQGVAPYFLEIDIATFASTKGDITARIEGEYDHRLTQKLTLQPRVEFNFSAQDISELDIGAGIDSAEAGLRLRYQIVPEFAPYIGVEQEWKIGQSRRFAIAAGEAPSATNFVVGVRFWF